MRTLNIKKAIIKRTARDRIEALSKSTSKIPFTNNTRHKGQTFDKKIKLFFRRKPSDYEIAKKLSFYLEKTTLSDFSLYIKYNLASYNNKDDRESMLEEIIELLDALIEKWREHNLFEAKKKTVIDIKPISRLESMKEYAFSHLVNLKQLENKGLEVKRTQEKEVSKKTLFKKELIFLGKILRDHYQITSPNQELHINQFLQLFGEEPMKNNQGIANSIQTFDMKNLENIKKVLDEAFQSWIDKKNREN